MTFIAGVCNILCYFIPEKMTILTWKNDVLSSLFFSKKVVCAHLRCLTEAFLPSNLCLEENNKTKVIYSTSIGMFPHDEL